MAQEGVGGLFKGLTPLWARQIPYTMMKFGAFENTVQALYKYVVPKPKEECNKTEQLGVSFAAGYIAGVFCAAVSHPADLLVSQLNARKGVSAGTIIKEMGYVALFTRSRTPHYLAYPRATRSLVVQAVGSHSIFSRHARTDVDGRDGMLVEPRCSDLGGECHTRRIVRCCYRPCRQRSDQRV